MQAVFVQANIFTADLKRLHLTDADLSALEKMIMAAPDRSPVMGGTGGLRKIRFAPPSYHTGKSGACRICYVWFPEDAIVWLGFAFGKTEKDNLSADEKAAIKPLIADIRQYLVRRKNQHGKNNR